MLKYWWRAISLLFSEPVKTFVLVTLGVIVGSVGVFEQVLFGRVVDGLIGKSDLTSTITQWALVGVVGIGANVYLSIFSDRLAHRHRLQAMHTAFDKAIYLPASYHVTVGSGAIVRTILQGSSSLFWLWLPFLRTQLSAVITLLVLIPAALRMDLRLSGLLGALTVFYLFVNYFVMTRTAESQEHVESDHNMIYSRVGDVLGNLPVVQGFLRMEHESREMHEAMGRLLHAQYPVLTWWGILTVLKQTAITMTMVALFALGSYLVRVDNIPIGTVVSFVGFSYILIGKLDHLADFAKAVFDQAPALKNFFQILDSPSGIVDLPGAIDMPVVRGHVRFENVSFSYGRGGGAVHNLTFEARPGETVALIGTTGSGKSTTMALLQHIYDVNSGAIYIDGVDIKNIKKKSIKEAIAVVYQEVGLFNRPILENIQFGNLEATMQQIEQAAKDAEAHEFILQKPMGYGQLIGERGAFLSGGERQRIAIARALLKNSPILILDEATSALDQETERRVQLAFDRARAGRTTFIIAHRLSTIESAHRVIVFEKGRIKEIRERRPLMELHP